MLWCVPAGTHVVVRSTHVCALGELRVAVASSKTPETQILILLDHNSSHKSSQFVVVYAGRFVACLRLCTWFGASRISGAVLVLFGFLVLPSVMTSFERMRLCSRVASTTAGGGHRGLLFRKIKARSSPSPLYTTAKPCPVHSERSMYVEVRTEMACISYICQHVQTKK